MEQDPKALEEEEMVKAQHRRKPEFNERYYICRCTEGYYSNFSITAKYNKRFSKELLSNALQSMIRNNSWFTLNFFKDNDDSSAQVNGMDYEVRCVEKIKFSDVVSFRQIEQFDATTLEEVNMLTLKMNVNLPLWRIIVFEEVGGDQYVCVYVDHSHYDGLSAVQFHKDLTKELSLAVIDHVEVLFDYKRDFEYLPEKILPPVETLTDLYIPSYAKVVRHYLETYIPGLSDFVSWASTLRLLSDANENLELSTHPLFYTKNRVERVLQTKFKIFNFSSSEVSKMIDYCRLHKITLSAYFDILCLQSLEETIFKAVDPSTQFSTSSLVAINGRRYYSEDIRNFKYGTMVCGDQIILPPIKRKPLESMKKFHKKLRENIKSKASFKIIGMYNYINCWDFFRKKLGKVGGRFSLTISNLGKIENSNDEFKFEKIFFASNTGLVYNFILNMTTTPDNELTVVFGYLPEFEEYQLHGKKAIDLFANQFQTKLRDFSKEK
ncbi:uncharacterized protein J8A68_002262 [[Candida] subhashii]|uniref:Alcohol acetyltransferase n=1 Tax=[Candida] subhashii TaxID=561895 RepID=A0A8J5QDN9_9ASCO|nr:uncharacterized protein J8A68_002262 [[Candida] subhashii]KAG7664199.1 hypothetical protein J8A68_002262 [[Candida] subhashii]